MTRSQLTVSDDAEKAYTDLRRSRQSGSFIFLRVEGQAIGLLEKGKATSVEDLAERLPLDESLHVVYDQDGFKMLYILWSPEGSSIRSKMVTAASTSDVYRVFEGVGRTYECLDRAEVVEKLTSNG